MQPIVYIIIAIITSTVSIGIVLVIHYFAIQKKHTFFVLQNSVYLKQLNEINKRYNFYPHISFDQFYTQHILMKLNPLESLGNFKSRLKN